MKKGGRDPVVGGSLGKATFGIDRPRLRRGTTFGLFGDQRTRDRADAIRIDGDGARDVKHGRQLRRGLAGGESSRVIAAR